LRGFLFLLLLLFQTTHAITLEEAEKLAVKNYPKIKRFELLSESSQKSSEVARRERFGTLNVISSYTTFNKNFILTPMYHMMNPQNPPPFDSRKLIYGVSFTVPIYLGGTISRRVEISKLKGEIYRSLKREAKWQVRFNVDATYLNYLKLKEMERALIEYEKSLEKLRSDTQAGVDAGKFARVDLLKVEYSLEQVKSQLDEVRKGEETLITVLETLTGTKIKGIEPFRVSYRPLNPDLDALYSKAVERNSLLASKRGAVKVAEKLEKLTEGKYGLRVFLDGGYTVNYGFDSGKNVSVGSVALKLSYPVFEWGRKGEDVLSKELLRLSEEKELKSAELELKRELSKSINTLLSIQSDIAALKKKLELADEVERIERLKYRSGKGDMNHLLLAESQKYLTKAQLEGSFYSWEVERRRIATLVEVENEKF